MTTADLKTVQQLIKEQRDIHDPPQRVDIIGVDIPLGDMFRFMVKLVVASIPAIILAGIIYTVITFILTIIMMLV